MISLSAHEKKVWFNTDNPTDHIQKILSSGTWYELDLLESTFGRLHSGIVIDVGAHIGTHTLWFAGIMNKRVVCFEPFPQNWERLIKNIRLQNSAIRSRITPRNVAVGAHSGFVRMALDTPNNTGMARVVKDSHHDSVKVAQVTIDSQNLRDVGLIKIDVEGKEMEVLQGAEKTIAEYGPLLYVEARDDEAEAALLEWAHSHGYGAFGVFGRTRTIGFIKIEKLQKGLSDLSVTIMAHPARASLLPGLLTKLDYPAEISLDRKNDRWDTGRRALLSYNPSCSHHLVIQDDAVVPSGLIETVKRVLKRIPAEDVMVLYTGNVRAFIKKVGVIRKEVSWLKMPSINWGVGIVIPTSCIERAVSFGDVRPEPNYDLRLSRWLESEGRSAWYPLPSLLDHLDSPSMVPGRGDKRHAWKFIGPDATTFNQDGEVLKVNFSR